MTAKGRISLLCSLPDIILIRDVSSVILILARCLDLGDMFTLAVFEASSAEFDSASCMYRIFDRALDSHFRIDIKCKLRDLDNAYIRSPAESRFLLHW